MLFSLASEVVVLRTDPEFADMDNPRGEVYGEAIFIVATESVTGKRKRHFAQAIKGVEGKYSVEALQALCDYMNATDPDLNPDLWQDWYPVYGSPAYIEDTIFS